MSNFLKRLELNGFKSFAAKTAFEFPGGIIGIVGPNGSGKSNIVDSLKWLLGEREAKNLRGGKVEDLIFAGTQKRARSGMASASLIFENRDKFFPVDFEEVVITREISRSGTSKYFLNKSEILLRDLQDFFAKARLGSRGLVIIGQGDSDIFVRATPFERREMMEEILGLREYQIKKTDAERRLKNSRINLDKTRALVEEILPHLRSLKRQTARWERRGELENELRSLETVFFGTQLRELSLRENAVKGKLSAAREGYETLKKELAAAEGAQRLIEDSQPEEKKALAAIRDEIRKLSERRSDLQKDIGRIEAQIELSRKSAEAFAAGANKNGVNNNGGENGGNINGGFDGEANARATRTLIEILKKIKRELENVFEDDPSVLRASVKKIIKEIDEAFRNQSAFGEVRNEAAAGGMGMARAEDGGISGHAGISDSEESVGLKSQFEKLGLDLSQLDVEIRELRNGEQALELEQEGFYSKFKSAAAGVQSVKDKLSGWDARNRELLIEEERIGLRRDEILHQISQAGRREEEFRAGLESEAVHEANNADSGNSDEVTAGRESKISTAELPEVERRIFRLRGELAAMGEVDEALVKEARETEDRYEFLKRESEDLERAVADLAGLMGELGDKIKTEFAKSLSNINEEFGKFFALMFGGGVAKLSLERSRNKTAAADSEKADGSSESSESGAVVYDDGSDQAAAFEKDPGVEIDIKLPRKKITSLEMLSGGERSLVGIAALFAMVSVSPPPFLVLDEIDAPLDERNARRFGEMLKEFSKKTQFIVVTHNRATMEAADILYGITLGEDGSSKVISMKFEEASMAAG